MEKAKLEKDPSGKWMIRDTRSGRFLEVRGANAMKSSKLPLRESLDLTKPIAEQALAAGSFAEPKPMPKG